MQGRDTEKVQDFIATIFVYTQAEGITGLPLLPEDYDASWCPGVKGEASTFEDAINLIKSFAQPKPDWHVYTEIC